MTRDRDTFGGRHWTRPRDDGRGHSQRELQDRAGYDNAPTTGCGAVLFLLLTVITALLGALT